MPHGRVACLLLKEGALPAYLLIRSGLICIALWNVQAAASQIYEVKGEGVRFQPEIITARVGDVIAFRKMTPHAVESVESLWPQGAAELHSEEGADVDYVIPAEGIYVFRCPKHWGARMVGAIVVEGAEDVPGTVAGYLAQADNEPLKPAKRVLKRLALRYPQSTPPP